MGSTQDCSHLYRGFIIKSVDSTCISPGRLTNGAVNSTKSIYQPNEAIRFTCNINYTRIGKSELTCQRDGTWNRYKPICLEVSCTNFHHPGYGRKKPRRSKFFPGEKIVIECKRGYTLLGKSSLICQSDGSWDGHWPHCSAPCPHPKQPKNGIQLGKNIAHGQTVRFKCNFYFKRIGSSVSTCINGKWNNQPPKCAAPCPDPGTPINGHRYNHSFQHGDQVVFTCDKGMLLIGRKIITCSDGRWDQMTPTCLAVDCGRLPIPQHGEKIGEIKTTYLGEVSFRCYKKGYQLKGSSRRVCQENGKWDGTLTSCEPVECQDPGKVDFGGRNPDLEKYVYESKIEFSCKTNHTLKGDKHIICQHDKKWTGTKPACLRPCSDPGIPRSGHRLHHSFLHADKVSFTCKSGWKMDGEKNIECNNGNWDNKAPTCLGKCYNPGSPYNGWRNGDDFFEGKQVTFACSYGYNHLVGRKTLECLDSGRWSGPVPTCKRRCAYRRPSSSKTTPIIADGVSVRHGTSIKFVCINDYTLVGQQTAVCNDGRWNHKYPMCKAPCHDPGQIANGILFGRTFTHRRRVRYVCIKGYSLDNPAPLICNDGRWNRPVPSCKKYCDDPGTPRNAIKNSNNLKHGSQVTYTCNGTSQLVGARRIVCNDVKWSSHPPNCSEICQLPQKPENGHVLVARSPPLSGDKAIFFCNLHYDLIGSKEILCDEGTWNGNAPRCAENCQDPGDIPNGVITKNGFKHGDKISIRCKSGFRIKGSTELICNNGQWANPTPECVGFCVALGHPMNGQMLDFNFDYGSTVRFRCNYGFSLRGLENVTCNNGKWNSKVPICKANCLDPGTPTNGERKGDLFTHLQTVSFSCQKDFTITGSSKIQCIDGKWTAGIPDCTECSSPLGMENKKIPDKNIRASSSWGYRYDARYARLNRYGSWCSGSFNKSPYLEVELEKPYRITYIATQGSSRDNKWETKYTISYTLAKSSFVEYRENGKEKVFNGNSDATSVVKHKLKKLFIARKVRFHPIGWRLFGYLFKRSCMRVEIYGCNLSTDCVMVGSRVLGNWGSNYHGGAGDVYYKSYVKKLLMTHTMRCS